MNKIIGCGCSFTYGYVRIPPPGTPPGKNSAFTIPSRIEDYVTKLSTYIGAKAINIARPGASNYAIAKQIEYAITLNPSLVIIGATTPERVDFSFPETDFKNHPTINDFDYSKCDNKKFIDSYKENIVSMPIINLPERVVYDKRFIEIFEYHTTYTNPFIKKDQDRLTLLGAFSLLSSKNIPYECVDFAELFRPNDIVNYISFDWRGMNKRFPSKHDIKHFNEDGHSFISGEIQRWMHNHNIGVNWCEK
jgi:hypothetical protein